MERTIPTKITRYNIENIPALDVITKNQNDNPAVTASDLKRGDESCIV